MIFINMHGQLGNQMFQYAFARMLQKETGDEITIGFQAVEKYGWKNKLDDLNVRKFDIDIGSKEVIFSRTSLKQKVLGLLYLGSILKYKNDSRVEELKKNQLKWQKILNKNGLYWINTGYFSPEIYKTKNAIVKGQFDNPLFFEKIKKELKEEFEPKNAELEINKEIYKKIRETNSVALCVRKGDYVSNLRNKFIFDVCDTKYYEDAIHVIIQKVRNPVFFVFSDDMNWVSENIHIPERYQRYYENSQNPTWETLRLMYNCKHFIISNSTFHWWGQYLSKNEKDKVVVSPSIWFNPYYSKENSLIDPTWEKIDIDNKRMLDNKILYEKGR